MKSFWNLTAVAFVSAALIGCGESAPPPAPPPNISLGDSSTAAEAPAGNSEPEAKKDDAEQPKSEDKPKDDGAAKTETPKANDNEVALASAAPKSDGLPRQEASSFPDRERTRSSARFTWRGPVGSGGRAPLPRPAPDHRR